MFDYASESTRAAFTALVVVFAVHRAIAYRRIQPRFPPWLYALWFAAMIAEVWLLPVSVHVPMTAAGVAFIALSIAVRMTGLADSFRRPKLVALRAEIVGLPALHGAVLTAFLGWLALSRWARTQPEC